MISKEHPYGISRDLAGPRGSVGLGEVREKTRGRVPIGLALTHCYRTSKRELSIATTEITNRIRERVKGETNWRVSTRHIFQGT